MEQKQKRLMADTGYILGIILYSIPIFISALLMLYVYKRREKKINRILFCLFSSHFAFCLTYLIELVTKSLEYTIFWDLFQYIPLYSTFFFMVYFSAQFNHYELNNHKNLWIAFISYNLIMIGVVIYSFFNPSIFIKNPYIKYNGFFYVLSYEYTPLFYFYMVDLYVRSIICIYFFRKRLINPSNPFYRKQALLILFDLLLPVFFSVFPLLNITIFGIRDQSPLFGTIGHLVLFYAIYKLKVFEIIPIARERIIEELKEGICVFDNKNRLVDLNREMISILELDPDQTYIGEHARKFFKQYDSVATLCTLKGKLSESGYNELDSIMVYKDDVRYYNVKKIQIKTASRHKNAPNRGYIILFRDITEQVKVRSMLEMSAQNTENLLRIFLNSVPNAFIMIKPDLEVLEANQLVLSLIHKKRGEVIGYRLPEFFDFVNLDFIHEFIESDRSSTTKEISFIQSKKKYHILFNLIKIGENIGLIGTDITDLKNIQKELEEKKGGLEQALKEKQILVKEIHHRVKNNLQIISAISMMHENNTENEDQKEIFRDFQHRMKAMAQVHEILYRSENLETISIEIYIEKLVNNLVRTYQIDSKRINFVLNVENLTISLNKAVHFGLIINEILTNALKYAFPGRRNGTIKINFTKNEQEDYVLNVKDNGIGIPAEINTDAPETMGLKIIQTSARQLNSSFSLQRKDGTNWRFVVPK